MVNLDSIRKNPASKLPLFGWLSKVVTTFTAALALTHWPSVSQADTTENSLLMARLQRVYVEACKNGAADWLPTMTINECHNKMVGQFTTQELAKLNRIAESWAGTLSENQKKWMDQLEVASLGGQSVADLEAQVAQHDQVALGPVAGVAVCLLPLMPVVILKIYTEYEIFKGEYLKSLQNNRNDNKTNCINDFMNTIRDDDPNRQAYQIQAFKLCNTQN